MLLHLERAGDSLSLWGERFGVRLEPEEVRAAIGFLFPGWRAPVLEGRGVLAALQSFLRGAERPFVRFGADFRHAAELLRVVWHLVAAGRVVPRLEGNEARWRATVLPEGADAALLNALIDSWMRTTASTTLTRAQAAKGRFHTAEDAFLAALRAPCATLAAEVPPHLAPALDRWATPLYEGSRGRLRLHPRPTSAGWFLDFAPPGQTLAPRDLRLLGQAIALAPALAQPQPWSAAAFADFLRRDVPALRAATFTVALPPELEAQVPHLEETAVDATAQVIRLEQRIRLGDLELTVAEAQALVDAGEALVCLEGHWRFLDLAELRRLLEALGPTELPRLAALPLLLAGTVRVAPNAQAVQDFLRELSQPPAGELPLRKVLRPYQAQGVCWLMQAAAHGLGVCLADDMGLGKTLQTIAFLLSRPGPALVVAPLTVLPVWERELKRWAPTLKVRRHEGPDRPLHLAFRATAEAADITLTAYGYLWRDFTSLRRVAWQTLILDEAQAIKNPATRQSQAARSLSAACRLALTGTPIENRLDDLWSLLDFLNPDRFGTRRDFLERYAQPERLRRATAHFLLRRLKSDPAVRADLPPKILQFHYAPLTPLQAAAYDAALADYTRQREDEGTNRAGAILVLLTRLKEICDGLLPESEADFATVSGKALVLLPLLDDIFARGESVLLFTQFTRVGELLQRLLAEHLGRPIPFLHGALTPKQRRAQITAFNTAAEPLPFILSLRTGAFGLTLTKANHVVHLDRWWNPAVENQATDRVHRIGQHRTVIVHHLLCRGTLEERIDQLLRDKTTLANQIVAPTPAALLARLPDTKLLGLLRRD